MERETCAARLVRILDRERRSPPGEARWLVEEEEQLKASGRLPARS